MWASIFGAIAKPLFSLLAKFGIYKAGESKGRTEQKLKTSEKELQDSKDANKLKNTVSQKSDYELDSALSSDDVRDNDKSK